MIRIMINSKKALKEYIKADQISLGGVKTCSKC